MDWFSKYRLGHPKSCGIRASFCTSPEFLKILQCLLTNQQPNASNIYACPYWVLQHCFTVDVVKVRDLLTVTLVHHFLIARQLLTQTRRMSKNHSVVSDISQITRGLLKKPVFPFICWRCVLVLSLVFSIETTQSENYEKQKKRSYRLQNLQQNPTIKFRFQTSSLSSNQITCG